VTWKRWFCLGNGEDCANPTFVKASASIERDNRGVAASLGQYPVSPIIGSPARQLE
jgi:hypothetical protein